jgi:signal transduction histidine kinase
LNMRFQAIVEERSRMAREMHDTLAQGFSGLTYQLEGLARALDASPENRRIEPQLAMALELVRHCREEAHRSIFALRSLTQAEPDLVALLLSSCDSVRPGRDVRVVSACQGKPFPIPDEIMNHLLRIGQEALTNALRHAEVDEVRLLVRYGADDVTLEIADKGQGFDPDHVPSVEAGHFGITGMRERARRIQATLSITSAPGKGTRIAVRATCRGAPSWLRGVVRRRGLSAARSQDRIFGS